MNWAFRICVGAAIAAAVIWAEGGAGTVSRSLSQVGWPAIATAALSHGTSVAVCGLAWWSTAGRPHHPRLIYFLQARWVRDAIGQLLPLVPLGGEVAGARLLGMRGLGGTGAAAVTIVDITAETLSQTVFTLIGAVIWGLSLGTGALWGAAGVGIALMVPMVAALIAVQRMGLVRLLETLSARIMPNLWQGHDQSAPIHASITALYADRRRFAASCGLHLLGWAVATVEAWAVLALIGAPIAPWQSWALESVVFAVRSAAFLVPAAIGVQEGAYAVIGAALGLPVEAALALALVKRARELTLGLPALGTWFFLNPTISARTTP